MHSHVQRQAMADAGKGFLPLIREYAKAGYSRTETAHLLGYASHPAFLRLLRRNGLADIFRHGMESVGAKRAREYRKGRDTPALRRAREKRQYPHVTYNGVSDTYAGHARRLGLNYKTVMNRKYLKPGDLDYIFSGRAHDNGAGKSKPNHAWRNQSVKTRDGASDKR